MKQRTNLTILDRINEFKRIEVARRRQQTSLEALRDTAGYGRRCVSLADAIRGSKHYGIIAEFKRKSPSQQDINVAADPSAITAAYANGGAAGISCLTDQEFFGAQPDDIDRVRAAVTLPVIRKDFTIDRYQIHEAKAMGADAILLIAASLSAGEIDEFAAEANEIGLEVLCEIHNEEEAAKLSPEVNVVGVNNRNLKDFTVSISNSIQLVELLPPSLVRISESGIDDPQSVARLRREGYDGFLIGTHFMRQADPGRALRDFIAKVGEIEELYDGAIA
ncbi:indole-3-glycerol phosphate synthase TrpC [Neolewinella antarctica]|uniref:indole-3-glycerol-phosphate synthase n=1 Tax=Neolewinella antarctica TaxID=442734 RepID=A0ABX0X7U6_9BACT|nr:indole-3-glycerol phosphate synthase TrpC [Neolewinella antarctica]NJC25306.1 indole-3-glycerol phosphate synthase [Neolewinella antarctica]